VIKTTVDLDEYLMNRAMKLFKGKTKKEIITIAITDLVERHEKKDLYDLFDSDEMMIAEDYDYKALRGGAVDDIG